MTCYGRGSFEITFTVPLLDLTTNVIPGNTSTGLLITSQLVFKVS